MDIIFVVLVNFVFVLVGGRWGGGKQELSLFVFCVFSIVFFIICSFFFDFKLFNYLTWDFF